MMVELEELCCLSASVRDAEMLVVDRCHAPVPELDELMAEDDAGGKAKGPVPGAETAARMVAMLTSVRRQDLGRPSILVRECEVMVVVGPHAPVAKLDESISPSCKLGITRSEGGFLSCKLMDPPRPYPLGRHRKERDSLCLGFPGSGLTKRGEIWTARSGKACGAAAVFFLCQLGNFSKPQDPRRGKDSSSARENPGRLLRQDEHGNHVSRVVMLRG